MTTRRGYGWYVVALLAASNFLNYAQRNVLYSAYDDLRATFALSDVQLGLLGTIYMGAHALGTLPAGWLGDRVDRRRLIAVALLLWSAAALAAAGATNFATLAVARGVTGLATACVVPVANAIIAETFPSERKASVLAVFNLGLFFGGVTGAALGAFPGFPDALIGLAIPGLFAALLVVRIDVPRRPVRVKAPGARALYREARDLLRIRTLRWLMVSTTLMAFAAGGLQAWLLDFLKKAKGMSEASATSLLGAAFLGGLCGVIAGGRIGDAMRRRFVHGRLLTIAIGMGSTVPFALLAILVPPGPGLVVASIGTMFFISWYHGPMAATVDDLAPPGRAVSTQALVIFSMHLLGTAPASWLVGEVKAAVGFQWAMLLPTAVIGLAGLAMVRAFGSFAADAARHGSTHASRDAITDADG
ncbi:MAG: MFS transporter [Kofleriaceae bacterium]|nr:MFS transporter [Myxococcales bacterium]MCB9565476.1 MFS transporter [Kofleriaceae bacterium]MCB9573214.1 MFS transporter [Kofleriaceae bacterium]